MSTPPDWDNDGDLDLLVGNNPNRIAYFENIGTRSKPKFAKAVRLLHDQGEHFSFRSRPALVDYYGDGLIDLIATQWQTIEREPPRNQNQTS